MPDPDEPRAATSCARATADAHSSTPPLAPPIQLSAVYRIAGLDQIEALNQGRESGFIYARDAHPNAAQLAAKIALLEGAEAGLVCASGMAAESAVFLAHLSQGDRIVVSEGLYGRTTALVARELARFGIDHAVFDPTRPETLRDALSPNTRVVFVETLSNPLLRVSALDEIAEEARGSHAIVVVDHTFAPLLCRPLERGAELVTHSATKLIGGHSDLTLGVVAGSRSAVDRATVVATTFGLTGNPFESWLALRGTATLALRVARTSATAHELAERLARHPAVSAVHYPGLTAHPDHARACKLLTGGFGAMVTIDLGNRDRADAFIRSLCHVPFTPSLGDVATTLSHPSTTSHRSLTPEQSARQGIHPGLVRLSIGLEDPRDLWADFDQALRGG
jgi:cystathionine beta-lyase/cystathionine gamma-synthase